VSGVRPPLNPQNCGSQAGEHLRAARCRVPSQGQRRDKVAIVSRGIAERRHDEPAMFEDRLVVA